MSAHKIAMRVYRFYAYRVIYAMHLTRLPEHPQRNIEAIMVEIKIILFISFFLKKLKGGSQAAELKRIRSSNVQADIRLLQRCLEFKKLRSFLRRYARKAEAKNF
jgi:hypothetical protein